MCTSLNGYCTFEAVSLSNTTIKRIYGFKRCTDFVVYVFVSFNSCAWLFFASTFQSFIHINTWQCISIVVAFKCCLFLFFVRFVVPFIASWYFRTICEWLFLAKKPTPSITHSGFHVYNDCLLLLLSGMSTFE